MHFLFQDVLTMVCKVLLVQRHKSTGDATHLYFLLELVAFQVYIKTS